MTITPQDPITPQIPDQILELLITTCPHVPDPTIQQPRCSCDPDRPRICSHKDAAYQQPFLPLVRPQPAHAGKDECKPVKEAVGGARIAVPTTHTPAGFQTVSDARSQGIHQFQAPQPLWIPVPAADRTMYYKLTCFCCAGKHAGGCPMASPDHQYSRDTLDEYD